MGYRLEYQDRVRFGMQEPDEAPEYEINDAGYPICPDCGEPIGYPDDRNRCHCDDVPADDDDPSGGDLPF